MMLFDLHTHIFPDALAKKALHKLAGTLGAPYYVDGTFAATRNALQDWGVTHAAALHIAVKPSQQATINDWASSVTTANYFGFGSVHPDSQDPAAEVRRIRELGLKGIKLHPDYQHFPADTPAAFPIYEEAAACGLPVLFHTGLDPLCPDAPLSLAPAVAHVAALFPKLTVIAAHMGGLYKDKEAEEYILGSPIFIDTSMAQTFLTPERFAEMVRLHGAEKVLFGSDCPWSRSDEIAAFIEASPLSAKEKDLIYFQNAFSLFSL